MVLSLVGPADQGDIYISYPVQLEQFMMVGSYNKVFLKEASAPAETYKYFVEKLLVTLRDEIAEGIERLVRLNSISQF
jgi:26S proteasome regulatory subunit N12